VRQWKRAGDRQGQKPIAVINYEHTGAQCDHHSTIESFFHVAATIKEQQEPILDSRMIPTMSSGFDARRLGEGAAPGDGPQPPTAAGIVLRIASVRDGEINAAADDDEVTLVDSRIAM